MINFVIGQHSIDLGVSNIEVNETENNLYYYIEYSPWWNDEINNNYIFKGKTWDFAIVKAGQVKISFF